MSKKAGSARATPEGVPFENPLVPHNRMKQMYEGIVHLRLLEETLQKRHKKTKHADLIGEEACRVSILLGLDPKDLVSDTSITGTAFLRGVPVEKIVAYEGALSSSRKNEMATTKLDLPTLLPVSKKTGTRFRLATGAALALKRLKLPQVVVFFAAADEFKTAEGKEAVQFASREELPLLFISLPHSAKKSQALRLSAWTTAHGIPGIPVDADDAVALYRVAQESMGRLRGGDGPAFVECIRFSTSTKKSANQAAFILGQTLLNKKICPEPWLAKVSSAFAARLKVL